MLIRPATLMVVLLASLSVLLTPGYAGKNTATIHGKITEIINAAGYTYVEIDTGSKKVWAAGPNMSFKVGDSLGFATDMPMANFRSKSMQRDFDMIYFVDDYIIDNSAEIDGAASVYGMPKAEPIPGIAAFSGGQTIADVYANKEALKGKIIRVRGQVTKFSAGIMGKNWVHIMDSSSSYDLTMTLNGTAKVDDVVVIEGRLSLDRDFGAGYVYPIIVEDGKVI